jgi:arginine repressor
MIGGEKMNKSLVLGVLFLLFCSTAFAITAVEGKVEKIDRTAKTVVVKTADGTEHTFHFVGRTAVHGTQMAGEAAKESFHGLKEGSDVVVHYTAKGSEETAEEVDHIGEGGLKASEGTVTHLDRGAKTVTIKTADGTEQAFRLTDHAAEDAGKDISEGAEKSAKVTVYYTEQAGHKVAHFFSKAQ